MALWFTILQEPDKIQPEEKVLAVLAVFPIVSRLTDRRRYIINGAFTYARARTHPVTQNKNQVNYNVFYVISKVGGIFLIFLWILVDQLYIQMGVKKNDTAVHGTPGGSSALKRKNSSAVMVIDHSSYANSYATLPRPGKILGVGELERRHHMGSTPTRRKAVHRTKSMTSQ